MGHLLNRLESLVLSATEVRELTGWPDPMVEDYLNILRNILEITNEVENGTTNSKNVSQLVAQAQALISKLHSRVNSLDVNVAENEQDAGNALQLIASVEAMLGKHRASQNNINNVFDDQIGLRETAATGLVSDGTVFPNTATTVDVNFGTGEIVNGYTDRREPTRINVSWSTVIGMTILMPDSIGLVVITVDATGAVNQQPAPITNTQRRNNVQLAFVYYKDGVIDSIIQAGILSNEVGNTLYDWMAFTPPSDRVNGLGIDDVTGQLQIWGNAGELISPGSNITASITNPNIFTMTVLGSPTVPEPFDVLFADGSTYLSAQTAIPKEYESAPGVASGLTGQRAVIHYVYRSFGNNLLLQLGNFEYSGGADARDSLENDRGNFIPFVGAETTLLSAQVYTDNGASDFSDNISAGIVSLIGDGAGASGGISVNTLLGLSDVLETTYIGNAGQVLYVNPAETGVAFQTPFENLVEDLTPQLGGTLGTNNNLIALQDGTGLLGGIGTDGTGAYFARSLDGTYDPNDGALKVDAGVIEMHGAAAQVKTLAGTGNRMVFTNFDGYLYDVVPPDPGFSVSAADTNDYALNTLGAWVLITNLNVVIPSVVAVGEPLQIFSNIQIAETSSGGNRSGSVDISVGLNGAQPTVPGVNKIISGGFSSVVPVSITTTTHGGLAINDTVEIWVRRSTEDHAQFAPVAIGSARTGHDMTVSTQGAGGSIDLTTVEKLYLSGVEKVSSATSGIQIRGSVLAADPPTTELIDCKVELLDADGSTSVGLIGHLGTRSLVFRNLMQGGVTALQGVKNDGTAVNMVLGVPDSETILFYAGVEKLKTQTYGQQISGQEATSSPPVAADTINSRTEFYDLSGVTFLGHIGYNTNSSLKVRSLVEGGFIEIQATNSSGLLVNVIVSNPDGSTNLYNAGVNTAGTLAAVLGGFQIDNQITGGGPERALTTSDLTKITGGLPTYADDTAAGVGGLVANDMYKTSVGVMMIKL